MAPAALDALAIRRELAQLRAQSDFQLDLSRQVDDLREQFEEVATALADSTALLRFELGRLYELLSPLPSHIVGYELVVQGVQHK